MQVSVWLNYFNKQRYGLNNLNRDKSLDNTTFAILHTSEFPLLGTQPKFSDLVECVPEVAATLVVEVDVVVQRNGAVCNWVSRLFVRIPLVVAWRKVWSLMRPLFMLRPLGHHLALLKLVKWLTLFKLRLIAAYHFS